MGPPARETLAESPTPGMTFQTAQPAIPIAQRQVCALLRPSTGNGASIVGQDEIGSVRVGETEYWVFGDTSLSGGHPGIPNNIATASSADDPADCVQLDHKRSSDNVALPLLPTSGDPDEATVWPAGMVAVAPGVVHFFYASMTVAQLPFNARFIGLGRFDTATLSGTRLGPDPQHGSSFWDPSAGVTTARPILVGDTVYVFLGVIDAGLWQVKLARVPAADIEDVTAYTYWDAGAQSFTPSLANADAVVYEPWAQLPSQVSWNPFLHKWTMVYVSYAAASARIRVADDITGPWSEPRTLFDCKAYYPGPGSLGTYCYTGQQHDEYQADDGATIYVTVSNESDYRVFLHQIKFASPVRQYAGENGQRLYVVDGGPVPEGLAASEGIAFFAGKSPDPALAPIHTWTSGTETVLAVAQPAAGFDDGGIAFYAPASPMIPYTPLSPGVVTTSAPYEPVYRWDRADAPKQHVYSQFASVPGYVRGVVAFYAPCPDTDGDGASDCAESVQGTDPTNPDTDGDGHFDSIPKRSAIADPAADLAHDNCPTIPNPGQENHDGDFINLAPYGKVVSDFTRANSDNFGDACDRDADNDGLSNDIESGLGPDGPYHSLCPSATGPTDPLSADTDGDLVLDGAECKLGTNPIDPLSKPPVVLYGDTDHDGIADAFEPSIGTDPANGDTDGDGIPDGVEFKNYNTDPLRRDTDGDGCPDGREVASVNADAVVNSSDTMLISRAVRERYIPDLDLNKDSRINSIDLLIASHLRGACR